MKHHQSFGGAPSSGKLPHPRGSISSSHPHPPHHHHHHHPALSQQRPSHSGCALRRNGGGNVAPSPTSEFHFGAAPQPHNTVGTLRFPSLSREATAGGGGAEGEGFTSKRRGTRLSVMQRSGIGAKRDRKGAVAACGARRRKLRYLPQNAQKPLTSFVYKGQDRSYLCRYLWRPLCRKSVCRLPSWLSANAITVMALVQGCLPFFGYMKYAHCGRETSLRECAVGAARGTGAFTSQTAAPALFYLNIVALILYQYLDNLDGHQARYLNMSSPLGLWLDHGCDAFHSVVMSCCVSSCLCLGATWKTLAIMMSALVTFFMNTWEEYHVGELILPVVNGPNEGLLILMLVYLWTGIQTHRHGVNDWWLRDVSLTIPRKYLYTLSQAEAALSSATPAWAPRLSWASTALATSNGADDSLLHCQYNTIFVAIELIAAFFTCVGNLYNVFVKPRRQRRRQYKLQLALIRKERRLERRARRARRVAAAASYPELRSEVMEEDACGGTALSSRYHQRSPAPHTPVVQSAQPTQRAEGRRGCAGTASPQPQGQMTPFITSESTSPVVQLRSTSTPPLPTAADIPPSAAKHAQTGDMWWRTHAEREDADDAGLSVTRSQSWRTYSTLSSFDSDRSSDIGDESDAEENRLQDGDTSSRSDVLGELQRNIVRGIEGMLEESAAELHSKGEGRETIHTSSNTHTNHTNNNNASSKSGPHGNPPPTADAATSSSLSSPKPAALASTSMMREIVDTINSKDALRTLSPVVLLSALALLAAYRSTVFRRTPYLFFWTVGLLYTYITISLMLAHMCDMRLSDCPSTRHWHRLLGLCALVTTWHYFQVDYQPQQAAQQVSASSWSGTALGLLHLYQETVVMLGLFVVVVFAVVHLAYVSAKEMAGALAVSIFRVPKEKRRAMTRRKMVHRIITAKEARRENGAARTDAETQKTSVRPALVQGRINLIGGSGEERWPSPPHSLALLKPNPNLKEKKIERLG
eukprot:gene1452-842_t